MTYQMSRQHKFVGVPGSASSSSAATSARRSRPKRPAASAARSDTSRRRPSTPATLGNKLLVEAGWSENDETYSTNETQPSVGPTDIARTDRTTTERWSSVIGPYYFRVPDRHTYTGAASRTSPALTRSRPASSSARAATATSATMTAASTCTRNTNNGVRRASVMVYNTPQMGARNDQVRPRDLRAGLLRVQAPDDQPGHPVRAVQHLRARASRRRPAASCRRGTSTRSRTCRTGATSRRGSAPSTTCSATGKTAIKVHVGKYMRAFSTVGFAEVYNPMVMQTDRRTWTDLNGDDIAQDNEIGPVDDAVQHQRRQQPRARSRHQAPLSVGVQRSASSASCSRACRCRSNWVRRDFKRLFWTDNMLVSHSDYTIINVPNPLDPAEIIPIYNLNVAKRGQVEQIDKNSDVNQPLVQRLRRRLHRARAAAATCTAAPASAARSR